MDKNAKPDAYGVFKPVGHVVVAFAPGIDPAAAAAVLRDEGFTDIVAYTPAEMIRQTDHDLANAGVLASLGQELNLVKAHKAVAEQGAHFLVVGAPDDDAARRVAEVAAAHGATRAQQYGRLIIEELIVPGSGEKQVAESPDRGIDAQTPSGVERA